MRSGGRGSGRATVEAVGEMAGEALVSTHEAVVTHVVASPKVGHVAGLPLCQPWVAPGRFMSPHLGLARCPIHCLGD